MTFRRGQKVEVYRRSSDESWEEYMDEFIGLHGIIVDPDTVKNDPDDLIEVSLREKGTHRLPQDCLKVIDEAPSPDGSRKDTENVDILSVTSGEISDE